MMSLNIQIYSFAFSFVFGMIFSLLIKINYKLLFFSKRGVKIFSNFIFMVDVALLYFLGIKLINNGILHIYFFIVFLLGWLVGNFIIDKIKKK